MHVSRGDTPSCSRGTQGWPSSSLGVHSCPGLWHIHSSLLGAAWRGPSVSWAHIGGSDSSNRMAVILLGVVTPKEKRACMEALTQRQTTIDFLSLTRLVCIFKSFIQMKSNNIFSFCVCVAFFTQDYFAVYPHCYMLQSLILLLLNSIPPYEYTTISLCIHFWVDI